MITFTFYDKVSGEDFCVEAVNRAEAIGIAKANFEKPICTGIIDPAVAEMLGIDTY